MTPDLVLDQVPAGLLLTPGASADRDHATLVAIDRGLAELPVARLTLGTTSIKRAVATIEAEVADMAERLGVGPERIAIGGRSFGGRACSVAAADGLPTAALVLLSYPLHPPGKPEKLRNEHFEKIEAPTLFVSGRSDPFGTEAEFAEHLPVIAGPVRVEWLPGNHAPRGQDAAIVDLIADFFGLALN